MKPNLGFASGGFHLNLTVTLGEFFQTHSPGRLSLYYDLMHWLFGPWNGLGIIVFSELSTFDYIPILLLIWYYGAGIIRSFSIDFT